MCDDCKYVKYSFDGGSTKCGYRGKKDCNFIPREKNDFKAKRSLSMQIGDYVETIHGVNGILTEIRKGGYYGDVAFIATSDMRTFYCPVSDLKPYVIKE